MSARVYLMKTVKGCKDVAQMSPQSTRWTEKTDKCTLFVYCNFLVLRSTNYNRMQSKHKQTKCEHSRRNLYRFSLISVGITILNQRIILKDDIEFVTEFPCLLGHPVCFSKEFRPKTRYFINTLLWLNQGFGVLLEPLNIFYIAVRIYLYI